MTKHQVRILTATLPNVRVAVMDGIGMGSSGDGGGDAFAATGEKKSIADILKRLTIVDVNGCK